MLHVLPGVRGVSLHLPRRVGLLLLWLGSGLGLGH
jgi:hypothetical protein